MLRIVAEKVYNTTIDVLPWNTLFLNRQLVDRYHQLNQPVFLAFQNDLQK